jgi:hypothetical protein
MLNTVSAHTIKKKMVFHLDTVQLNKASLTNILELYLI